MYSLVLVTMLCMLLHANIAAKHLHPYKGWNWASPFNPGSPMSKLNPKITDACTTKIKNASFNLVPLYLSSKHSGQLQYYSVKDERSAINPDDDYKYSFNVCGPVLEYPDSKCRTKSEEYPEGTQRQYCQDNNLNENGTCNEALTNYTGEVFAYQQKLDSSGNVADCFHLSDEDGGPGVWSLINEDNPSEGVVVTYQDGDYDEWCGHNRQFSINFVCDNDHGVFGIPGKSKSKMDYALTNMGEPVECQYQLEFHTVYGCPSECPIAANKLCNGVGLCGYDWTIEQPRCYCYSLFSGDSCTEIDMGYIFKPKHDPTDANVSSDTVNQFHYDQTGPNKQEYHMTVTYDYTEWKLEDKTKPYVMTDVNGKSFTYYWNFMGDISLDDVYTNIIGDDGSNQTLHELGCATATGPCDDLSGSCDSTSNPDGYVFQVDTYGNCKLVGGTNVSWALYDSDNAARGVVVTFDDGGYCPVTLSDGSTVNKNRRFKLTLLCPDDSNHYLTLSENRNFDAFVEEDDYDFCYFHTTITSAYACPDECITDAKDTSDVKNDVSICSKKGMCASDPFSGYVHCICDDGWTGDDCNSVYVAPQNWKAKNEGSYIAAIVIISIILVAICYFGYKKINQHKQRVKELEIKLVNYQSSGGGGASYNDEKPPQIEEMPQSKGPSLKDKIKNKFAGSKKGKYSNLNYDDDNDDDEQELFNVKVEMNPNDISDEDEENDDDEDDNYKKPKKKDFQIGDDEEESDESDDK